MFWLCVLLPNCICQALRPWLVVIRDERARVLFVSGRGRSAGNLLDRNQHNSLFDYERYAPASRSLAQSWVALVTMVSVQSRSITHPACWEHEESKKRLRMCRKNRRQTQVCTYKEHREMRTMACRATVLFVGLLLPHRYTITTVSAPSAA